MFTIRTLRTALVSWGLVETADYIRILITRVSRSTMKC